MRYKFKIKLSLLFGFLVSLVWAQEKPKDTVQLEEVVVTALGIKRQEKALGYDVSTVTGADLDRSQEQNIIQGLAGKAAGVQIIGSGGTPGASSKVLIRGLKSFTNNDPLIVIDGVVINNSTIQTSAGNYPFNANLQGVNNSNRAADINPDDVESVSILKGPAAAALYGSAAGNGVILYTTKKGKAKKGIGIDLNATTEFSEVSKLPDFQDKYVSGLNGNYINPANAGDDGIHDTDDDISFGTPNSWGPTAESLGLPIYDNNKSFYKTGMTNDYNLALYGGDEKSSFRAGFGYFKQTGVIPNTFLHKTSVRISGETRLSEIFKAGGTASYLRTKQQAPQNGSNLSGISLSLFRMPINYDIRNWKSLQGFNQNYFYAYDNPLYSAYENPFTSLINRTQGNLYFVYDQYKWLNVTVRGGWDAFSDERSQIFAISSNNGVNGTTGQIINNTINNQLYNVQLVTQGLIPIISDKLNLNYTIGGEIVSDHYKELYASGADLAIPFFYNLSNASTYYTSNYERNKIKRSVFAQTEFDFKDQLFLTASVRKDWSSTFDKAPVYPSISLSWVFTNTFTLPDWFSFGKFRYGFAKVGIEPPAYRTQTYFGSPTITDGFTDGLGFPYNGLVGFGYNNTLQRGGLTPETLTGNEFGLELAFLRKRFTLDISYYIQKSTDVFLTIPIAPSSGFTSEFTNAADIENKGIELELTANIIKNDKFNWLINVNFTKNKNEVTALANGVDEVSLESLFTSIGSYGIIGYPAGAFFGTKWERNATGDLIIGANGLPIVSSETGNIGDPSPDWTMGIRNTFTWKGFTLTALLDIRKGGQIWNGTKGRLYNIGRAAETAINRDSKFIIPGVKEDGTQNTKEITAQQYYRNYLGDSGGAAEQFVEDGGWVRLRDISLSYRFSNFDTWGSLKFIKYMELSIGGRNLWIDTDYSGVDPETSLTGAGSLANGLDYFNNPGTKSYFLTYKIGF